jgi:hypothetical protein
VPPQPFTLYDGPVGGGIIMWQDDLESGRQWKWLPLHVLQSEADLLRPNGMTSINATFDPQVVYMEPHGTGLGRRPKTFRCLVSTEHMDGAGERVYWALCAKRGPQRLNGVDDIPGWACAFGMVVTPLPDGPRKLVDDCATWACDPSQEVLWFEVNQGRNSAGRQFAALVYVAYHLRFVAGPRVFSMHLVAEIDGRPNPRRSWTIKP